MSFRISDEPLWKVAREKEMVHLQAVLPPGTDLSPFEDMEPNELQKATRLLMAGMDPDTANTMARRLPGYTAEEVVAAMQMSVRMYPTADDLAEGARLIAQHLKRNG